MGHGLSPVIQRCGSRFPLRKTPQRQAAKRAAHLHSRASLPEVSGGGRADPVAGGNRGGVRPGAGTVGHRPVGAAIRHHADLGPGNRSRDALAPAAPWRRQHVCLVGKLGHSRATAGQSACGVRPTEHTPSGTPGRSDPAGDPASQVRARQRHPPRPAPRPGASRGGCRAQGQLSASSTSTYARARSTAAHHSSSSLPW